MSGGVRPVNAFALVDIDQVRPNARNIRRDLGSLVDLEASVRAEGILQPLIVENRGDHFTVIAGHRRLAAARRAGLREVPCILRPPAEGQRDRIRMLVENVQRADLEPMDEALAYKALVDAGMTREAIARATGVTPMRVAARLDLLHLPDAAQQMVRAGELRVGAATQLARQVKRTGAGAVRTTAEPVDRCAPHFTDTHPLADRARLHCDLAGHPTPGRLGPSTAHNRACGACWEHVIRHDALGVPSSLPNREDPS